MSDFNVCIFIGRLTRDPEMKYTAKGTAVVSGSIANNRQYTSNGQKVEETHYVNFEAWGNLAEIINKYAPKGRQIAIVGRLKTDVFEGQDGQKKYFTKVVVQEMQLLGERRDASEPDAQVSGEAAPEKEEIPW